MSNAAQQAAQNAARLAQQNQLQAEQAARLANHQSAQIARQHANQQSFLDNMHRQQHGAAPRQIPNQAVRRRAPAADFRTQAGIPDYRPPAPTRSSGSTAGGVVKFVVGAAIVVGGIVFGVSTGLFSAVLALLGP